LLGCGAASSDGEKDEQQKISRHWGLRSWGPKSRPGSTFKSRANRRERVLGHPVGWTTTLRTIRCTGNSC
jgi:hypothetical protein